MEFDCRPGETIGCCQRRSGCISVLASAAISYFERFTEIILNFYSRIIMKVLVCEDDMIAHKVIEVALEKHNAEVIGVSDGRKALQFLKENTVDLIITDIHMPYFNGDDVHRLVRQEQNKNTPIIMISSDTEEEVIALALKSGVNDFIKKPIDAVSLEKRLRKFLVGE